MRIQLALNVEVNKRKPGYANFSVEEPPLKLVLSENADERLNHLGGGVFHDSDVQAATDRLMPADLAACVEDEQTCCYARQNKVWAIDPESLPGEYYRIVGDSETFGSGGAFSELKSARTGCCT